MEQSIRVSVDFLLILKSLRIPNKVAIASCKICINMPSFCFKVLSLGKILIKNQIYPRILRTYSTPLFKKLTKK